MVLHLMIIKMESKTYLEKRKELEDKINLMTSKQRRIRGNHSALFVVEETNKLYKELAELDEAEMEKCAKNVYYFATNYMTVGDKPYTTELSEEDFNKKFNELKSGELSFIIDKNRRRKVTGVMNIDNAAIFNFYKSTSEEDKPIVGRETFKLKFSKDWFGIAKE